LSTSARNAVLNLMNSYQIPTAESLRNETDGGNHKFTVISLFAGGGGSSTGYRMAGGKVLLVNEFIDEAVKTYKANWPNTKIIHNDIRSITPQDLLDGAGVLKGELDLLDGSPPCSAFSTAGSRDKGWGKDKKYSDKSQKNVEDLFFDYIRMVEGVQPKVFIAENVAGLAKGKAKGYLNHILRELRLCGYHVEAKILNAKNLGVPQSRNRLIIVGVRNDLIKDEWKGRLHPKPLKHIVTLGEAFAGLVFTDKDRAETDLSKYKILEYLKTLRQGEQHAKRFNLLKCASDGVSPCITATTGSPSAAAPKHWDNRSLSVSEVKRIMSVPDDYILTGTYQQKVERLGRMVTPFMYRETCNNLIKIGVLGGYS